MSIDISINKGTNVCGGTHAEVVCRFNKVGRRPYKFTFTSTSSSVNLTLEIGDLSSFVGVSLINRNTNPEMLNKLSRMIKIWTKVVVANINNSNYKNSESDKNYIINLSKQFTNMYKLLTNDLETK